jgi:hypothetical protein
VFLAWWFFAYFFIKGSSPHARVEDASFFRLMMPAFPGYLLLASSLPLLVPTYGRELAQRLPPAPLRRLADRRLGVAAAVFALIPLVLVLAIRPMRAPAAVKIFPDGLFVPIDKGFHASAAVRGRIVRLTWPARSSPGIRVSYRILRAPAFAPDPETAANPPIVQGIKCSRRSGGAANDCSLFGTLPVGSVVSRAFTDKPGPGRWTYFVAVVSNWLADPSFGDIFVLSRPVDVAVPRVE